MNRLLIVYGPTAIGKTALSIKLASHLPIEIISADSVQVYKEFNILSQKPSGNFLNQIPHYLVDTLSITDEFNAHQFCQKAKVFIDQIIRRKKIPLIIGGTGLYIKSLIDGLFDQPHIDAKIRQELTTILTTDGSDALYKEIASKDPETAKVIDKKNPRRLIRALEIIRGTGMKYSEIKKNVKGIWGEYDILWFGLRMERDMLYSRINERVDQMLNSGLLDEVKEIEGISISDTAKQSIGLNESLECLSGDMSLAEASDKIKLNTRHYAKRQTTWFKKDDRIRWVDMDGVEAASKVIEKEIKSLWSM